MLHSRQNSRTKSITHQFGQTCEIQLFDEQVINVDSLVNTRSHPIVLNHLFTLRRKLSTSIFFNLFKTISSDKSFNCINECFISFLISSVLTGIIEENNEAFNERNVVVVVVLIYLNFNIDDKYWFGYGIDNRIANIVLPKFGFSRLINSLAKKGMDSSYILFVSNLHHPLHWSKKWSRKNSQKCVIYYFIIVFSDGELIFTPRTILTM